MGRLDAARFLINVNRQAADTALVKEATATPESRILDALAQQRMIPLPDIPRIAQVSVDEAVDIVNKLKDSGKAVLRGPVDKPGVKYLSRD